MFNQNLFLGFDLSTQQLKVAVTSASLKHLKTYHVDFDAEFGQTYPIVKGVTASATTGEITSPVLMWVEALLAVLDAMAADNFPFHNVQAISGSCQQHGSVFWSSSASDSLCGLDPSQPLVSQLQEAFAYPHSPNWQDHSTGVEAAVFEAHMGGETGMALLTGSRAHARFTGLQIRKLATRGDPSAYAATSRISLVSSFLSSVLSGRITQIEESDACGMNMYDVVKREFNKELLSLAAGVHPQADGADACEVAKGVEDLERKLGPVEPVGHQSIGCLSPYFLQRYGFSPRCAVYSFTGDNLATILALPLKPNDLLVSLGTSTTALLITEVYNPSPVYHMFMHPTMPSSYMGMICYCNGSLARERVRDALNQKQCEAAERGEGGVPPSPGSWAAFDTALSLTVGFGHKLGIYFPLAEIAPNAQAQTVRYKAEGTRLTPVELTCEEDACCIVESQALSCRLRSGLMMRHSCYSEADRQRLFDLLVLPFGPLHTDGQKQDMVALTSTPQNVYFVGGASQNTMLVQKMASVLGASGQSYRVDVTNACAMGGAYKASWSFEQEALVRAGKESQPYAQYINERFDTQELEVIAVQATSEEYLEGLVMLARVEETLQ